jgi:3-hydroxymyristoyl/3-hydroxydecanoyl-(acyl carrier protein) dehydratase
MERLVDLIPHRPPWLLVDRVVARGDDAVEAEKRVAADDPLLAGDELPELIVLEALAQTAACANAGGLGRHQGLLVAAQRVEFEGRARAGDLVTLHARKTATLGALVRFTTEARVGSRVIARGELTFAVTVAP